MDAQTLYSIVKTWPLAAWPANVVCEEKLLHEKVTDTRFRESAGSTVRDPLKDDHAVLLFEAAGLRFLATRAPDDNDVVDSVTVFANWCEGDDIGSLVVINGYGKCVDQKRDRHDDKSFYAPTLIEAISKALLAVEGREG